MNIIHFLKKRPCSITFNLENLKGPKNYYYTDIIDLKPGDVVVVECRESITLASFFGYGKDDYKKEITKKIVSKIPLNILDKDYKYNNKGRY